MDINFRKIRDKERFLTKINKTATCWLWIAGKNIRDGYGKFWLDNKLKSAHRVSYEFFKGPIPEGLDLDHLCRVRHCVNPDHLEPVTAYENMRRSPFFNGNKTHCIRGHEFNKRNTIFMNDGHRKCNKCYHKWKQNHLKELRDKTAANPYQPKTHCIRGHKLPPFSKDENRPCKICLKESQIIISELIGPTRSKDHCINGHEYTPENSRINSKGYRMCVTCHRATANLPPRKDRTQCRHGHKFTKETIYLNTKGVKECQICREHRQHLRMQKIKSLKQTN